MVKVKHIVHVVENNTAPFDVRVWRQAKVGRDLGYNVSIICPSNKVARPGVDCIEGIRIIRYPKSKETGSRFGLLWEYANALFWQIVWLRRIAKSEGIDLVHVANPPDHGWILIEACKTRQPKFVYDCHDLAPELYEARFGNNPAFNRILVLFEKLSCWHADAIVVPNESFKKTLKDRHNLEGKRIEVVRNDPDFLIPSGEDHLSICNGSGTRMRIIYLGAINRQDGVSELMKVLDILKKLDASLNFCCDVIGEGDDLTRVKSFAGKLSLQNVVNFHGNVYDRECVKDFLRAADVGVEPAPYTKINNKSTFIKVLEYMAAGKPVVAFDLLETRESVGDAGILVPPGDLLGFAEAVRELLTNRGLRTNLGLRASRRIKEKFNWKAAAQNLARLYTDLLG